MTKKACELCAVCSPTTSLDFGPAGVETATADVSVGLEAHGQQVAGAGDLHGGGGGGAQLGQLRSCEVRAAVDLKGKQQERIQGPLGMETASNLSLSQVSGSPPAHHSCNPDGTRRQTRGW